MRRPAPLGAAFVAALAGACAGARPGAPAAEPTALGTVREVPAPTVVGAAGVTYPHAFLGGFNAPRPQWVDADGDGDLDLFVQEYTDRLLFFERVSSDPSSAGYAPPVTLGDLPIGEWYRFVDVDADGDPDLLGEERFSHVRLWRNRGAGAHALALEPAVDTLRDAEGSPIFADRQNIPNAADIDCDGRLDLLVGRTVGTITHYEATGAIDAEVPAFAKVTDRFEGIEIIGQGPGMPASGRGSSHGANTMALADVDRDGDLDLLWGDFFEPGLLLIENTGSCADPDLTGTPRPFPLDAPIKTSGYNAPAFGDLDADGDLDLLVGVLGGAFNANQTTADNLLMLEQRDGAYRVTTTRYVGQVDVGSESLPAALDVDADGDLDLLVSNRIDPDSLQTSRLHLLENVGRPVAPSLRLAGTLPVAGAYHNAPAFGDLDGDGDADLILGTWRSELRHFRNEAGPGRPVRFVLADSAFVRLTRGSNATPALGDLDGDGDLDLLVGESSGTINYYRNAGGRTAPRFELVSDSYAGIKAERRSAPALADLDGDGDLDLLLGTEREGIRRWINAGGRAEPRWIEVEPLLPAERAPAYSSPLLADMGGDGTLELIVGGAGGGLRWFEYSPKPGG